MKKLTRVSLQLNKDGFEWMETEWDAEEKIKIYKLSRIDEDGDKMKRVVFKEAINRIDAEYSSSIYLIRYACVCEKEKVREIKDEMLIKVEDTVDRYHKQMETLLKHIDNGFA